MSIINNLYNFEINLEPILAPLYLDPNEDSPGCRYKTLKETRGKVCKLNMECKYIDNGCMYKHGINAIDDIDYYHDLRKNISCRNGENCEYMKKGFCAFKH